MKWTMPLLLSVCLLSIAACGDKATKEDPKPKETATTAPETQPEVSPKTTPKETEPAKTEEPKEAPKEEPKEATPPPPALDHSDYDALLKKHVDATTGGVDYKGLKAEEAKLDAYLKRIAEVSLDKLNEQELYAMYINAYNAYTLKLILKNLPVKSITKLDNGKPWDKAAYVVAGKKLSLNDIEHKKLRPVYKDARIHFAVNCASVGCPKLRPFAFMPDTLDKQLEEVTKDSLTSERYVKVKKGRLYLTKIMEWYKKDFISKDFKKAKESLPKFVYQYANEDVRKFIVSKKQKPAVRYMNYNWNLNSKANLAKAGR